MPTQSEEQKSPSPTAEVRECGLCRAENAMSLGYWLLPWKRECHTGHFTDEQSWALELNTALHTQAGCEHGSRDKSCFFRYLKYWSFEIIQAKG